MPKEIVIFDEGEFEIAIATYNRQEFVAEWLERCYDQVRKRNIQLSIYDSSTNNDTEKYINDFKANRKDTDMEYHHVDSDIPIGYKSMLPLLNSKSKYVWVTGDSRCHDFDLLDEKVFPYLKHDIDYVILHGVNNEENDGKIYTDREIFLRDCFVSMTCLGLSIYRVSLFEPLKRDKQLKEKCDQKYKNNYGFGWIGYFLEMFAREDYQAVFSVVPIINIRPDKKLPSWFRKYYSCCIGDLCDLMDGLSSQYQGTETVIRETWKYLSHDIPIICYKTRKIGDLNKETVQKFKDNGMLERCTKKIERFERFAGAADEELESVLEQEKEVEKREFQELCCQNIKKIENLSKRKDLWIYGAGMGGRILAKCLAEHNVSVCGFLDKSAESINTYEGLPVKTINDVYPKNCFVVVSLLIWQPYIVSSLLKCGIERNHILYLSIECD